MIPAQGMARQQGTTQEESPGHGTRGEVARYRRRSVSRIPTGRGFGYNRRHPPISCVQWKALARR
jgi:hypothetical protein